MLFIINSIIGILKTNLTVYGIISKT